MKKVAIIAAVLGVILVTTVGAVGYTFLKPPEAASGPIEAIPVVVNDEATREKTEAEPPTEPIGAEEATQTPATTEAIVETTVELEAETDLAPPPDKPAIQAELEATTEVEAEADPAVATESPEMEASPEAATGVEAEAPETAGTGAGDAVAAESQAEAPNQTSQSGKGAVVSPLIFEIVPAQSEARFMIDEVLRGDPITVVGATDQVAGQFAVNPNDLSTVEIGPVRVNARTLATDNDFRNRAIKNRILLTDQYEFVTFTPKEVVGLPAAAMVGETYSFQVLGDLTVTGVTREVTFDVMAIAISETHLEAIARTSFLYPDFELFIPDAQAVDTVDDEVRLEIEFMAEANQN